MLHKDLCKRNNYSVWKFKALLISGFYLPWSGFLAQSNHGAQLRATVQFSELHDQSLIFWTLS